MIDSETPAGNRRNTTSEILRWIVVLPAAVLGAYLGGQMISSVVYGLISLGGNVDPRESGYPELLSMLIRYGSTGAFFVIAGTLTAPRSRLTAAIVLAACWMLMSLLKHILLPENVGPTNYTHVAAESLGAACGVACIRYLVWRARTQG